MEKMHESEMNNSFEKSWVRNADNDWLGPIGNIGHVLEINGSGARNFLTSTPPGTNSSHWRGTGRNSNQGGVRDVPLQLKQQFGDSPSVIRLGTSEKNPISLGRRN